MSPTDTLPHNWRPDHFLDRYELLTLALNQDHDGEDPIVATLVRKPGAPDSPRGAVLYVHGFTDYFFQEEMADFYHRLGYAFYGLDLRKAGRSLANHHQPHYISDLAIYDEELDQALDIITEELAANDSPQRVLVAAHSTGGLITPLWLDRLRRTDAQRHRRVVGLVLNSPWLDLQGEAALRSAPATALIGAVGRLRGKTVVPRELSSAYGESLHESAHGEWSYDLDRKPLNGFPVTFGWLHAVRQGQLAVQSGHIDAGVPALVLRSDKSRFKKQYDVAVDTADCVLDVKQIAQWSPFLSRRVLSVAIPDARHDVFLSQDAPRRLAYSTVGDWLRSEVDADRDETIGEQDGAVS
ncbi:alpha/beta hydrolase [Gordonia sp. VNK21]|uniref:alpha/beta hydrolase n=1 Tax=Gordonia sp. VNK21 TaxID=3382483 RepID=UPI0038D516EB